MKLFRNMLAHGFRPQDRRVAPPAQNPSDDLDLAARSKAETKVAIAELREFLGRVPDPLPHVGGLRLAVSDHDLDRFFRGDPERAITHRLKGKVFDDLEGLIRGGEALNSLDGEGDDLLVRRHIGE